MLFGRYCLATVRCYSSLLLVRCVVCRDCPFVCWCLLSLWFTVVLYVVDMVDVCGSFVFSFFFKKKNIVAVCFVSCCPLLVALLGVVVCCCLRSLLCVCCVLLSVVVVC